jgi:hypothetical protein
LTLAAALDSTGNTAAGLPPMNATATGSVTEPYYISKPLKGGAAAAGPLSSSAYGRSGEGVPFHWINCEKPLCGFKVTTTSAMTDEDLAATVRLFCAAPAMLAALQGVAAVPGFEPSEPYGQQVNAAITAATE